MCIVSFVFTGKEAGQGASSFVSRRFPAPLPATVFLLVDRYDPDVVDIQLGRAVGAFHASVPEEESEARHADSLRIFPSALCAGLYDAAFRWSILGCILRASCSGNEFRCKDNLYYRIIPMFSCRLLTLC